LQEEAPDLEFEFVLTLPDCRVLDDIQRIAARLGVTSRINNLGRVDLVDGPALFRSCHICFMPTVLETFSATYVEAMAMRVPIIASDFAFARDICGVAAAYFKPNDAEDAAREILRVHRDQQLRTSLVEAGASRLTCFPSESENYRTFVKLLEALIETKAA
jgi:glycosyltransferase involved in cell wall biosynthesis